ncbi:MAG: hypothetical protein AAF127_12335 [Pseudomonadota bacterium]
MAARFFAALIIAWVTLTVPYIIGFSGAYDAYPQLTFAPFNTELWLGPLWLLTVRALTGDALTRRWWLWLAPGIAQTLYYMACFFLIGPNMGLAYEAGAAKFAVNDAFHEPYVVPVETGLSLALIAIAVVDSWVRIRRYRRWIAAEHSNQERVDLAWLERSGAAMIALAALWLSVDLAQAVLGNWSYSTKFLVLRAGRDGGAGAGLAISRARGPPLPQAARR